MGSDEKEEQKGGENRRKRRRKMGRSNKVVQHNEKERKEGSKHERKRISLFRRRIFWYELDWTILDRIMLF